MILEQKKVAVVHVLYFIAVRNTQYVFNSIVNKTLLRMCIISHYRCIAFKDQRNYGQLSCQIADDYLLKSRSPTLVHLI